MKLNISTDLALPLDWMTLATVVYGARGSGKTTLGAVIAEEVTRARQRFCAIDLKGDWYGLKSTADGKGDGIPVVVFGGDHADVPLEDGAGAFIGETIATLEQPAILDLEYFSKGKQVRFLAAFFETLYDRNREPLLLLLDEAQRYAPQKPIDPDAAKCLGAVEDLVKLGRKHGIGPVLFTQRGSGLNKEVSELCDMMVAFRTPGPLDQDRVKGWLEANTTKTQMQDVMASLSGLPTGTAIFASGHPDLKVFGTYSVRRRETFDSSATPKVGQRKVEPKVLAQPDLESLRTRMSAAIERQKADDPKALRADLAAARKKIAELEKRPERVDTQRVDVPVLANGALDGLKKVSADWLKASENMLRAEQVASERAGELRANAGTLATAIAPVLTQLDRITGVSAAPRAITRHVAAPRPIVRREPTAEPADASLDKAQRGVLQVLAQYPEGCTIGKIALLAGYRVSGTFRNALSALRTSGYIEGGNTSLMRITDAGMAAGDWQPLPAGEDLRSYWINNRMLSGLARSVLGALIDAWPKGLTIETLAEQLGYQVSGTFRNSLSELRTAGLIEGRNTETMRAAELLFGDAT